MPGMDGLQEHIAARDAGQLDETPMTTDHEIISRRIRELEEFRMNLPGSLTTLPTDSEARKEIPLAEGVLRYFPAALAAVARVSKFGNDKHNGKDAPLHHSRGKSMDHADCILRHLMDMAERPVDKDGIPEVAYLAWRALALCQQWCEENEGAPLAPNATVDA